MEKKSMKYVQEKKLPKGFEIKNISLTYGNDVGETYKNNLTKGMRHTYAFRNAIVTHKKANKKIW